MKIGEIYAEHAPAIFRCLLVWSRNASIAEDIKAMYMRDLRKRAAGLADDMEAASKLLQHSSKAVTEKHYRRGDKLRPVR